MSQYKERKSKAKKKKPKPKIRPRIRHQSTSEGSCASSVDSEDLDFFETSPELPRKVLRAEITLDWSDEVGQHSGAEAGVTETRGEHTVVKDSCL